MRAVHYIALTSTTENIKTYPREIKLEIFI